MSSTSLSEMEWIWPQLLSENINIKQLIYVSFVVKDLINDSYNIYYNVIVFLSKILGFNINIDQIEFSIKCSSFKNLKKNENKIGFFENEGKFDFFRSGKSGNWKNELNISQIKLTETNFKSEMRLIGYL